MEPVTINWQGPIAVGGIGGSGTRVVVQMLIKLGFHMGQHLNASNDNLDFTARFKHLSMLDLEEAEFLSLTNDFLHTMLAGFKTSGAQGWGWKEPNTHIVVERLLYLLPELRYIHVWRNAFDMAHSSNQNQPRFWGPALIKEPIPDPVDPRYSLKYWCLVHQRLTAIALKPELSSRILFLDFDRLCRKPESSLSGLCEFVDVTITKSGIGQLAQLVNPPSSIGRWREQGLTCFDLEDINYAMAVGGG